MLEPVRLVAGDLQEFNVNMTQRDIGRPPFECGHVC
jgi:hypothetical protein